jgi:hypothetical protein
MPWRAYQCPLDHKSCTAVSCRRDYESCTLLLCGLFGLFGHFLLSNQVSKSKILTCFDFTSFFRACNFLTDFFAQIRCLLIAMVINCSNGDPAIWESCLRFASLRFASLRFAPHTSLSWGISRSSDYEILRFSDSQILRYSDAMSVIIWPQLILVQVRSLSCFQLSLLCVYDVQIAWTMTEMRASFRIVFFACQITFYSVPFYANLCSMDGRTTAAQLLFCIFYWQHTPEATTFLAPEVTVDRTIRYKTSKTAKVNVPRDSHKSDSAVILNDL